VGGPEVLSRAELGRATLARQLLLDRADVAPDDAIQRVAGLQAQLAKPPYVSLWSRIAGFAREDLTARVLDRSVVKTTMMRHTLHLTTARDYLALRRAVQPSLTRAFTSITRKRLEGLDLEPLVAAAADHVRDEPRTFAQIRDLLAAMEPDRDPSALAYAARTFIPLVQVPAGPPWGYDNRAPYLDAETFLGAPLDPDDDPRELVRRYLAAFGPASVRDAQAWSGVPGLQGAFEALRPELRTFRDERGTELFDVPGGPLPDAGTPAPPRFLPEFDNVLLAHHDRSRVVSDEDRKRIALTAARMLPTFLVDGVVHGAWSISTTRGAATITLEPFRPLQAKDRRAVGAEAEQLVRLLEPDAATVDVRFG